MDIGVQPGVVVSGLVAETGSLGEGGDAVVAAAGVRTTDDQVEGQRRASEAEEAREDATEDETLDSGVDRRVGGRAGIAPGGSSIESSFG